MDTTALAKNLAAVAAVWQLIGAVLTFKAHRDRRAGLGNISTIGYVIVYLGIQGREVWPLSLAPGLVGLAAAIALFEWSRRTVRGKFFSYINSRDVPQFVCREGPYRWIRHPFYASYLLCLTSVTVLFPNVVSMAGLAVAFVGFNDSAAFEEKKFESSPVAEEYAAHKQRTGRFLPRLHGPSRGV